MQTLRDFVKKNKRIIVVAMLTILLVVVLLLISKGSEKSSTTSAYVASEREARLCTILSNIDGVGATEVLINESGGEVVGVVIVSEGADNIMVKSDILNVVSTALNIDKKIIVIYSMKN